MVKILPAKAGDTGLILGSGRSPGEGKSNPLQYSCLGNPMDRGAWWATVHRVAKSRTSLSDRAQALCMSCLPNENQLLDTRITEVQILAFQEPADVLFRMNGQNDTDLKTPLFICCL